MTSTSTRLFGRGSWTETSRIADGAPRGDRRRRPPARRGGRGPRLGELPVGERLRDPARHPGRPGVAAPGPDARHLGRRRAAGDLLLRRGPRAQARVRRRRPARAPAGRAARRRRRRRHGGARAALRRCSTSAGTPARCAAGRSPRRPTSRSRSPSWRSSAPTCRRALRTFLLTLAVVDDLLAIVVIAIFYTAALSIGFLALSLLTIAAVRAAGAAADPVALAAASRSRRSRGRSCTPPGVHATVAGVLLAFTVPVDAPDWPSASSTGCGRCRPASPSRSSRSSPPGSRSAACPASAPRSATASRSASWSAWSRGKAIGISAATWLVARFTRAQLDENLGWPDVVGLSLLGGIGFTVSLLITELAYGAGSASYDHAKVGILAGTVAAALLAAVLLRLRNRRYRRIARSGAPGRRPRRRAGRLPAAVRRRLRILRLPVADPPRDVPSSYTREEVVRNLLSYRTREVAVR